MTGVSEPSYSHGASAVPLLGETIGANLRRVAARHPDREALVASPGAALDLRPARRRRRRPGPGADRGGLEAGRPARHLGAELRRVGPAPVRDREGRHRSWSTSTRPTAPRARVTCCASRAAGRWSARSVQDLRLPGHGGGGPAPAPALRADRLPRLAEWEELARRPRRAPASPARWPIARPGCSFDDPINIQYTSGTTGFPKGATLSHHNILNNGFFIGEGCGYTEQDRVCIPVPFYHCFGMVLGNLACTTHGACIVIPAPGFEPAAALEAVAGRAVHRPLRRADHVHRRAGRCPTSPPTTCSRLRTGIMAGSPCPVEVMKQVVTEMHMTEVTICYGMTETSPVSTQTRPTTTRSAGCPRWAGCTPTSRSRSSTRRPAWSPRAATPGSCAPGVLGDARLLGRRRSRRPSVIDAARWMHTGDLAVMDADGYLNIVGPDQGHGHPGRRERLPARGGGVPLHPPGDRGRPGGRRPRRQVRRGGVRLGHAARRAPSSPRRSSGSSAPGRSPTSRSRGTAVHRRFPMTVTGKSRSS